jgi:hypothetical protein
MWYAQSYSKVRRHQQSASSIKYEQRGTRREHAQENIAASVIDEPGMCCKLSRETKLITRELP